MYRHVAARTAALPELRTFPAMVPHPTLSLPAEGAGLRDVFGALLCGLLLAAVLVLGTWTVSAVALEQSRLPRGGAIIIAPPVPTRAADYGNELPVAYEGLRPLVGDRWAAPGDAGRLPAR